MKLAAVFTCALSLVASVPLAADDESGPACDASCPVDLFITFFPEPFVKLTLEKFAVPLDQRVAIQKELLNHELDINSIVESKAAKMTPNPLNQPDRQDDVVRLYDEAVLQVFTKVMNDNGITDDQQIAKMLEDINRQKAERFKRCMMLDIEYPK
jgi:hypothetical protein